MGNDSRFHLVLVSLVPRFPHQKGADRNETHKKKVPV